MLFWGGAYAMLYGLYKVVSRRDKDMTVNMMFAVECRSRRNATLTSVLHLRALKHFKRLLV